MNVFVLPFDSKFDSYFCWRHNNTTHSFSSMCFGFLALQSHVCRMCLFYICIVVVNAAIQTIYLNSHISQMMPKSIQSHHNIWKVQFIRDYPIWCFDLDIWLDNSVENNNNKKKTDCQHPNYSWLRLLYIFIRLRKKQFHLPL